MNNSAKILIISILCSVAVSAYAQLGSGRVRVEFQNNGTSPIVIKQIAGNSLGAPLRVAPNATSKTVSIRLANTGTTKSKLGAPSKISGYYLQNNKRVTCTGLLTKQVPTATATNKGVRMIGVTTTKKGCTFNWL